MHRHHLFLIVAILAIAVIGALAFRAAQPDFRAATQGGQRLLEAPNVRNEPIQPIPLRLDLDPRKVDLGLALFLDGRLSADNMVACDSCHKLNLGGADRLDISAGIYGRIGKANAPTVFNTGFNFSQFWNGRAKTLEEQIDGPIHSPFEMDSNWSEVIAKLKTDSEINTAFSAIYNDGVTADNIKDAIATFERSLYTPNSPFDRWLGGDEQALTPRELEGFRLFKERGCSGCHYGKNVGGASFAPFGLAHDYFAYRSQISEADLGRFAVTGREEDRHIFKVPGLRNVELTGPYFHDASARSLEQAVALMGYAQHGKPLPWGEVGLITAFLRTLTGELDGVRLVDSVPLPPQLNMESLREFEQGAHLFGAYCASCHAAGDYVWGALALDAATLAPYTTPQALIDAASTPEHPKVLLALEEHETRAIAAFLQNDGGAETAAKTGG